MRTLIIQRITVGLNLGDKSSYYRVLNATSDALLEQKVSTTRAQRAIISLV